VISDGERLVVSRTPLRLTLGGGGTDLPYYCERYGADLLTVTLSLSVNVVVRGGLVDGGSRFHHDATEIVSDPALFINPYVREALSVASVTEPCEIASVGPVPSGTGLGSSGAFAVGLLSALYAWRGAVIGPADVAEAAFTLEAGRLGRPVGRQDHYACALGGLRRTVISPEGVVTSTLLQMRADALAELERRLHLFYTGKRRDSSLGLVVGGGADELSQRIEALHRIRAIGDATRRALENGEVDAVAQLMREHWQAKRRRGDQIWDEHLISACQHGARAGKIVGAGGGGFFLLYADPGAREGLELAMADRGMRRIDVHFVTEGTRVTDIPGHQGLPIREESM
jgi:D-glycero-alpha-D-manno-heptose-7-phosphate kinase